MKRVFKLIEIDLNSLSGCGLVRKHYIERGAKLFSFDEIGIYDHETLLELSKAYKNIIALHEDILRKNAKDLFEFFYDKTVKEKYGYYSFQFPIDLKKFHEIRVPRKMVAKALSEPVKNAEQISEYMDQNYKNFRKLIK